ncbi:prealbumin-like fold domain-containing protein [Kurthia massiliensis]|uniref:prealbumin-like fold domain-containing protein n=1 Tax=Kurthia massiliensis TaxID=1033739 RepID=UPI0002894D89|nr:prealbumin-like fold domain-containing protein [Kurthia massiliensis]
MNFKKYGILFMIVLLTFQQFFIVSLNIKAAETNQENTILLSSDDNNTVFLEWKANVHFEKIQMKVPNNISFNSDAISEMEDINITYDETSRLIEIVALNTLNGKVSFEFINDQNIDSYTLQAIGFINGEQVTSNALIMSNLNHDTIQLSEETEANSDVEVSEQAEVVEKASSTADVQASLTTMDDITDQDGKLSGPNLEIYMEALQQKVISGKAANFRLDFKVTGSRVSYSDIQLTVNLPQSKDFPIDYPQISNGVVDDTLNINGVKPVYDTQQNTLVYTFDSLPAGQSYKVIVNAVPVNGLTPIVADRENFMTASATVLDKNSSEEASTVDAKTKVISDLPIHLAKQYVGVQKNVNGEATISSDIATIGSLTVWKLHVSVPKTSAGLTYIKENSQIKVEDLLPKEFEFDYNIQPAGFTGQYDTTNNKVTWLFDAPTLEQQINNTSEYLFEKELTIILKVKKGLTNDSMYVKNDGKAYVETLGSTDLNPTIKTAESYDATLIAIPVPETEESSGSYLYGYFGGALDGFNGTQDYWRNNLGTIPVVTDAAKIKNDIYYMIAPAGYYVSIDNSDYFIPNNERGYPYPDVLNYGYKHLTITQTIDTKLNLESITLGMPYSDYDYEKTMYFFDELPDTYIQLKINGVWQKKYKVTEPYVKSYAQLDLSNYGKKTNDHVQEYRVTYENASGEMATHIYPHFSIYEGSLGRATNSIKVDMELNNGKLISWRPINDNNLDSGSITVKDRHIDIVEFTEMNPTVSTSIKFVDDDEQDYNNSNISRGKNRVQVRFDNIVSSLEHVKGPVELVAVLPEGVRILDNPKEMFLGNSQSGSIEVLGIKDGKQYIKVTFDENNLSPNAYFAASFGVEVLKEAHGIINLEVNGYAANPNFTTEISDNDVVTNSKIFVDDSDLNNNGNSTESRVQSGNQYAIIKNDNIQIVKEVKGVLDQGYSYFGRTKPGSDVSYRFNLTNISGNVIHEFMLLDVLPTVGDLGITDNVNRDSQFEVTLKGPITFVGTKWQNQVDVLYSTSKNPSRSELYSLVDYPTGSSPYSDPAGAETATWLTENQITDWSTIHSFKVVMKEGIKWLEGQDITFEVHAKAENVAYDSALLNESVPAAERAAWNSFAVTANGLLPVEPNRVGVVLESHTSDIELLKIDKETGQLLQGAEFEIYPLTCKNADQVYERCDDALPITKVVTDENGEITFTNLPLGHYEIVEVKSPDGYKLLQEPIKVDVLTTDKVSITVENEKNSWYLPEAGGLGTLIFYLVGALFILMAIILTARKNKASR